MRFYTAAVALFASVALAQSSNNAVSGTPTVVGGEETTLEWTNPGNGAVDIWIQPVGGDGLNIQADDGFIVASDVQAADLSASFTVPADQVAPGVEYTFRIVDANNPNNYNFSPGFTVAGATGEEEETSTGSVTGTNTDSATETVTNASETETETETDSASTTETDSETTTASETQSRTSTSRSTSASATATTVPDSNSGVDSLKVQGGMVAALAAAVAML